MNSSTDGMVEPDTVTIPMSAYKDLRRASRLLEALEAAGVDNWEWYSDAVGPIYREEDERSS